MRLGSKARVLTSPQKRQRLVLAASQHILHTRGGRAERELFAFGAQNDASLQMDGAKTRALVRYDGASLRVTIRHLLRTRADERFVSLGGG